MYRILLLLYSIFVLAFLLLLTGCGNKNYEQQGYIEGQFRYISANYSGVLKELPVLRGTTVQAGDKLFVLESQPESDALNQARAQVAQAEAQKVQSQANYTITQLTYQRQLALVPKGYTSKESFDTARTNFDAAKAQLAQAGAQLVAAQAAMQQAAWSSNQKIVYAPVNATVFDRYFLPGELVPANRAVLSLLAPEDIKVVFFLPETELGRIHLGETIEANCDSCAHPMQAMISFISPESEYTPPVIYSTETREKLVYRIEALPLQADVSRMHPGQPIWVIIK